MYEQRVLAGLLATTGALGATVALTSNAPIVQSDGQVRSVKVQYGDLNLSSQKGQEALSQRIHKAVDLVCYEPETRTTLRLWSDYRKCVQDATSSAWSQVRWSEQRVTNRSEPGPQPQVP